jgi:hypothetical protein
VLRTDYFLTRIYAGFSFLYLRKCIGRQREQCPFPRAWLLDYTNNSGLRGQASPLTTQRIDHLFHSDPHHSIDNTALVMSFRYGREYFVQYLSGPGFLARRRNLGCRLSIDPNIQRHADFNLYLSVSFLRCFRRTNIERKLPRASLCLGSL